MSNAELRRLGAGPSASLFTVVGTPGPISCGSISEGPEAASGLILRLVPGMGKRRNGEHHINKSMQSRNRGIYLQATVVDSRSRISSGRGREGRLPYVRCLVGRWTLQTITHTHSL